MSDILKQIIANKDQEVVLAKSRVPLSALQALIDSQEPALDFTAALQKRPADVRIIAECKKKSPSRGVLCTDYEPAEIAAAYEKAGAAAISVLTDEVFFGGALAHLQQVKDCVKIPVLRKDFIIDEYQIYESRRFGADAFLLLAGVLDAAKLQYFIEIGRELGMEPLVEAHSGKDLEEILRTDARIVGINNRDLRTMRVDLQHALDLAAVAGRDPQERLLVCESGIKTRADVEAAEAAGFQAFLVGETLVTSDDRGKSLALLRGKL